jgi:hypothetical protein
MATTVNYSYPLSPPTVSGNTITLDTMLDQPVRITRFLSDLSLDGPNFALRIFSGGGGVTGGALIYDQLTANELYPTRDVQNVEPGAEFPLVTTERLAPRVAQVEKFGGKFFVTDEARDRNSGTALRIPGTQLINAIIRKMETRALAVLDASITEYSTTMPGTSWLDAAALVEASKAPNLLPAKDFAAAQNVADLAELGVKFDLWIVHPTDLMYFQLIYGENWRNILSNWGISFVTSTKVTPGTAYVVQEGMVGEVRFEQPLKTETWREPQTQRTWVQSDVRPVFAVTNPYAILKVTGLEA